MFIPSSWSAASIKDMCFLGTVNSGILDKIYYFELYATFGHLSIGSTWLFLGYVIIQEAECMLLYTFNIENDQIEILTYKIT